MNDDRLNSLLRQSLTADHPNPQLNQTIQANLETTSVSGKAGFSMKRMNRKKTLILAAALAVCILFCPLILGFCSADDRAVLHREDENGYIPTSLSPLDFDILPEFVFR